MCVVLIGLEKLNLRLFTWRVVCHINLINNGVPGILKRVAIWTPFHIKINKHVRLSIFTLIRRILNSLVVFKLEFHHLFEVGETLDLHSFRIEPPFFWNLPKSKLGRN